MAADKKVGKGEKIGSVVGGIGGLALGAVDGPLPVGDVVDQSANNLIRRR